ncbi:plasmid pRiA4b ORF-3 family protein [Gordonia sp. VNQ95]|jgi:hypothetical protein|uniref:plasmid pRiA4b ORF-3 family protein n=1 Tax=Gordonia sp. VNQ95 TaxID=3156619 RepID=UPI0032B3DA5B
MGSKDKGNRGAKRTEKSRRRGNRRAGNVIPIRRDSANVERLLPAFDEWLDETGQDDDAEREGLVLSAFAVVRALEGTGPAFSMTSWVLDDVDRAYSFAEYMDEQDDGPSAVHLILAARMFVDFLVQTSRWTGTPVSADIVLDALDGWIEDHTGMGHPDIPEVDAVDEYAALTATRTIGHLDVLLEWIGTEKPTTANRWLKPALLPDLVRDLDMGFGSAVTSMSQDPLLSELWELAQALGLIEVNTVRVRPGHAAQLWRSSNGLDLRRAALAAHVAHTLAGTSSDPAAAMIVSRVIYQGMTPIRFPKDSFDGEPAEPIMRTATAIARLRLHDIVDDGWLTLDAQGCYIVPPELRPAVSQGFPDEWNPDLMPEAGMLTLRVDMPDIDPPVWRRVRVASMVGLADMHQILQVVMGWQDHHLHQFTSPCEGHVHRYMPGEALERGYDVAPGTESEDDMSIGDLLGEPGAELFYEYDFGDGWEVRIVVESIDPETDEDPIAAVLDGSGTAPFEDSGGPPGWADLVAAINDPAYRRHEELRNWAGLPPGVSFDPTAFDVVGVNRALRV